VNDEPLDAKSGHSYYSVMKIRLIVEKDPETGRYSSVFPELPGCASAGDTEDEAIANAREALELWFEPSEIPVPETARLVEVTV
jgi:predicted RNase H-like HicB family nuclease